MVMWVRMQEDSGRRRLLIVEDNNDTAQALKWGFEQLGYNVASAHDGPLALRVAAAFEPNVALVDISLPVMDGWELAKRLRIQHGGPLHLIALTGFDDDIHRTRSRDAGFAAHLVKPVDVDTIHRVVERLPD